MAVAIFERIDFHRSVNPPEMRESLFHRIKHSILDQSLLAVVFEESPRKHYFDENSDKIDKGTLRS